MAQVKGTTTSGGGSSSRPSSSASAAFAAFDSHVGASNPTVGVNAGYGSAAANAAGAVWGPGGDIANPPAPSTTSVGASSKSSSAGSSYGFSQKGQSPGWNANIEVTAGGNNPGGGYSGGGYSGGGYSGGGYTGGGVSPTNPKPTTEELLNQEIYNPSTGNPGSATGSEGGSTDPSSSGEGSEGGSGSGNANNGGGNPYQFLGNGAPSAYTLPELEGPNPERVNHVDTETLRNMLQQIVDLSTEQANNRIDYSVERGTNELNRAMEDAAKQYQTQRDQATAEEARALDNQALYAEARGDRGGIGEAQYASIQNTAAQNRRAVNDAQVKLGTDTARQIADLRAQGEFQKADQLLSITQSHLAQLKDLEQWALGTNLGVDEFNSQLQQWVDEFNLKKQQYLSDLDLSAAQLTGMFSDGTRTYAAQQALIESLANSGNALLQAGVMPSRQQLEAMGLTEVQAKAYFDKMGFSY